MTNWEEHYQQKDTPWDKGAPSPALLEFLTKLTSNDAGAGGDSFSTLLPLRRVLVPGCGMGHDVRALAAHAEEVVGLDIAQSAVSAASALPRTGGERYECADLFALPERHRGAYDLVWEHTCFCAIDRALRPAYVNAVADALRPGGHLLAVFYLDPGQALATDGPPFETTLRELNTLFAPRFDLHAEWPPAQTFPGREKREWMRLLTVR